MSFMSFTKYPHGAFMMCESLSEMDPNMPKDPSPVDNVPPEQATIVADAIIKKDCTGDYLVEHMLSMGRMYHEKLEPLMKAPLYIESVEERKRFADHVADLATEVGDFLRGMIVEANTKAETVGNRNYIMSAVKSNAGIIIKNLDKIQREGYHSIRYMMIEHPVFHTWATRDLVISMTNALKMFKDHVYQIQTLKPIIAGEMYDTITNSFTDTFDMLSVLFDNCDRRQRQEQIMTHTSDIRYVIKELMHDGDKNRPVSCEDYIYHPEFTATLLCRIAHMVQNVRQSMYDLSVSCIDDENEESIIKWHQKMYYHACTCIVNTFIVSTLYIADLSYAIQNNISKKEAYDAAVKQITEHFMHHS